MDHEDTALQDASCSEQADLADLTASDAEVDGLEALLALTDDELSAADTALGEASPGLAAFLAPGGGWGGSEVPARRAVRLGAANSLVVTSTKRSTGSSGSDHHVTQRTSFAVDLSNGRSPTPQMLRTARQIAAAMGYAWPANGYLQTATTAAGYRAQLIYDSSVIPDHHNHVHFGVRKVR